LLISNPVNLRAQAVAIARTYLVPNLKAALKCAVEFNRQYYLALLKIKHKKL